MATKAKSKTAVAVKKSQVPVSADLMAKIRADIEEQSAMIIPSTSNRIRLNSKSGKQYVFPDKTEVDDFEAIVVDFATTQVLYDGPYAEGQLNSIVCYAAATKPADLAPMEGVASPQAESCRVCPNSKFGANSEKPACSLRKPLAIMMDGVDELLILDLPVMAAKQFDKYAQSVLVAEGRPIYAVKTRFTFDQTVKFDSPRFELVEACDGDEAEAAFNRRDEARNMLLVPPNFQPVEKQAASKGKPMAAPKKRAK